MGAGYLAAGLRAHQPSTLRHAIASLKGKGLTPIPHHHASELRRPGSSASSLSQESNGESSGASHSLGQDNASQEEEDTGESGEEEEGGEPFCCTVESLGLGGNRISDDGVASLAEALTQNTSKLTGAVPSRPVCHSSLTFQPGLQSLSLSDNKIGNKGAKALADMVRTTAILQKLILSGNSIRTEGASQLVAALSQNSSLKQLFLANVRGGAGGGAGEVLLSSFAGPSEPPRGRSGGEVPGGDWSL